jgi:hypothetical protein
MKEAKRRLARIQQDYESGGGIYALEEGRQRVSHERESIAEAEVEKTKLEVPLKQLAEDNNHAERMERALQQTRDANLSQATFAERRRIVDLLDVKVFPREDRSGAFLTCAVSLEPVSHHSINIASPKL